MAGLRFRQSGNGALKEQLYSTLKRHGTSSNHLINSWRSSSELKRSASNGSLGMGTPVLH